MTIVVPERFSEILTRHNGLEADVRNAVDASEAILSWSRLPLFPDYTDHGIQHLNSVLVTAASLVKEDSWPLISPADVALLIVAVLLHDLGMHISEEGFAQLVNTDPGAVVVDSLDRAPWPTLWRNYLVEATRFDQRKLKQLFNSTDPVHPPPPDIALWTKRDRLVAGEFIRRHHPRLAHEVAIRGIPTGDAFFRPITELAGLADLAGLIARSHGSNLRDMFSYLNEKYHLREFQGAHAVFLMVVLRVADYLQVEANRAPSSVLVFKKLTSPFSKGEWLAHAAVRNVSFLEDDPEGIEIKANPSDVRTFLRLQAWLSGFQQELDVSWAVLGEVYGRIAPVNQLGIVLRRVRSNIDDTAEFAKHVRFVPARVAFEAADADLLKLLVSPLYGDRPEVGIRELVQNSVDAVREVNRLFPRGPAPQTSPDVRITLESNSKAESWLTVEDSGIGMNADVVREYFLKAGASFRRSSAWREHFEDASGHANVLRSGRFGVGAIAAFLLGDEIEVRTRRADEPEQNGISFHAQLDDDIVDLERRSNPQGTLIRIRMRPEVARRFSFRNEYESRELSTRWDWYCLGDPIVERRYVTDGSEQILKQGNNLPNVNAVLPVDYARTTHSKFDDIQWTYADAPALVCNGIIVKRQQESLTVRAERLYVSPMGTFLVGYPNLSVFDSDGWLPLNLQRTELTTPHYPFTSELRADVTEYIASFMVNAGPARHIADPQGFEAHASFDHPALGRRSPNTAYNPPVLWGYTISNEIGFTLATPRHLSEVIDESVVVLPFIRPFEWRPSKATEYRQALALDPQATAIAVDLSVGIGALHELFRTGLYAVSSSYPSAYRNTTPFGDRTFAGCRIHMTKWFSDQYVPKLQRRVASLIVVELETSETKTITIGEVGETKVDLTRLPPELLGRVESDWPGIIMEWYFKPEDHSVVETDDVTEHWARFVGEILIPYDTAARSDVANRLGEVGARSVAFANSCRSNSSRQSQENVFNGRDIDLEDQDIPTV